MCSITGELRPTAVDLPAADYQQGIIANNGRVCIWSTIHRDDKTRLQTVANLRRVLWFINPATGQQIVRSQGEDSVSARDWLPFAVSSDGSRWFSYTQVEASVSGCNTRTGYAFRMWSHAASELGSYTPVMEVLDCYGFAVAAVAVSPNGSSLRGCVLINTGNKGNVQVRIHVQHNSSAVLTRQLGWRSEQLLGASLVFDDVQQGSLVLVSRTNVRWVYSVDGFRTHRDLLNVAHPAGVSPYPWHCFVGHDLCLGFRGTVLPIWFKSALVPQPVKILNFAPAGTRVVNAQGSAGTLLLWWTEEADIGGRRLVYLGAFDPVRRCGGPIATGVQAAALAQDRGALSAVNSLTTLLVDDQPILV